MKKVSETEGKIIQWATDLIQKRGVNGFSFADIATEIGIKKASIHYYFPSKQDLVLRVIALYSENFAYDLQMIKDRETSITDRLSQFAGLYRRNLETDKLCLCTMLSTENHSLSDSINQAVAAFFQMNHDWLHEVFKETTLSSQEAQEFFAMVQGLQVLARASQDLASFDQVIQTKINQLQKK
ncbi:Transcriptional regulator, TetR family [Streptococcus oralis]|uniref:Transcriptional regulator, TetR family n=1 Tax=Streptococcus oralis TaxID=1303 RepID=A0A139RKT5_STROR|nr:TetR/AcrR family transcriptional regulator [Streptococcus oralis]KXU15383.1 Transcriptional regulator, TetR family [Streptococcus oralis]